MYLDSVSLQMYVYSYTGSKWWDYVQYIGTQYKCTLTAYNTYSICVHMHVYFNSVSLIIVYHIVWCMDCVHVFTLSSVEVDFHEVM